MKDGKLISKVFLFALLLPVPCAAMGSLRRSLAVLSVAGNRSVQAFTSTEPSEMSFTMQQRQPWQKTRTQRAGRIKNAVYLEAPRGDTSALISLLERKDWAAASALLDAGVKVRGKNKDGFALLDLAIILEAPLLVLKKMLISGAAISLLPDKRGLNTYAYASMYAPASRELVRTLYAIETTGKLPTRVVLDKEPVSPATDPSALPSVLKTIFENASLDDE